MLDNTIIVYTSDNAARHHSIGVDWPMFVLGNLAGKLKSNGRYLAYPQYGTCWSQTHYLQLVHHFVPSSRRTARSFRTARPVVGQGEGPGGPIE